MTGNTQLCARSDVIYPVHIDSNIKGHVHLLLLLPPGRAAAIAPAVAAKRASCASSSPTTCRHSSRRTINGSGAAYERPLTTKRSGSALRRLCSKQSPGLRTSGRRSLLRRLRPHGVHGRAPRGYLASITDSRGSGGDFVERVEKKADVRVGARLRAEVQTQAGHLEMVGEELARA